MLTTAAAAVARLVAAAVAAARLVVTTRLLHSQTDSQTCKIQTKNTDCERGLYIIMHMMGSQLYTTVRGVLGAMPRTNLPTYGTPISTFSRCIAAMSLNICLFLVISSTRALITNELLSTSSFCEMSTRFDK
jgi:hypothetical protein